MQLHAEAYRRVLQPWGVHISDETIFDREGARSETIIEELLVAAGHNPSKGEVQALANGKQEAFKALGPSPLYPEAPATVRRLRDAIPKLGLVTGTRRENLERLIPDLLPLFDAVLAQEDYSHDKPHPEPYALAAAKLGVDPNSCAALENAVRGVRSARAAGYAHVLGITTTMAGQALLDAGADAVVETHVEAAHWLIARCGRN